MSRLLRISSLGLILFCTLFACKPKAQVAAEDKPQETAKETPQLIEPKLIEKQASTPIEPKGSEGNSQEGEGTTSTKSWSIVNQQDPNAKNDYFELTSVRQEGAYIVADVAYSGGCKEHIFDLVVTPDLMKSIPPQLTVVLLHNSQDDLCEAWKTETLKFEPSGIAKLAGGAKSVKINFAGKDKQLLYTIK